jgi:hemerythrin-like domain-containing protein
MQGSDRSPPPSTALDPPDPPAVVDGFDVLDACHRQTLFTLGKLTALVARLKNLGPDAEARSMAAAVIDFFSTIARQHHEDEERHVFPKLLESANPDIVQAVLGLQQDHRWLSVDWAELSPALDAVASGQSCPDLDILHEGVEIYSALYHAHIALEESCIYPEARARLRSGERQEMAREMAARRRAQRKRPPATGD